MDQDGLSAGWIAAIYGSSAVLSSAVAMRGISIGDENWMLAGIIALIVCLTTLPITIGVRVRSGTSSESAIDADKIRTQLKHLNETIDRLNESIVLSDDARRVLNRRSERDLLCKAIQEDIELGEWDAGLVLVRELAERFGYREEAEEYRAKIQVARHENNQSKLAKALVNLDAMIEQHRWEDAFTEAARISRVYHESPQAQGLRHRVESSRDRYKLEIERRFLLAAQEERVDQAMELLKEMDQYLTEHEADQFQEVARGVIGKARENLGVQFKLAISDKAWDRAAGVGERIIEEFPNSRMAEEVRMMIDSLRSRASAMGRS
ncbi:MAG: hypothetical protein ACWA5W_05945 [Phycisphaerales bacterium]